MKFIDVDRPDFTEVGESLVDLIKRRIQSAPGDRWNKTGRLLRSIDAVERDGRISIVTSSDRLQSPRAAELFAQEILPTTLDEKTRKAIATAIFGAFEADVDV